MSCYNCEAVSAEDLLMVIRWGISVEKRACIAESLVRNLRARLADLEHLRAELSQARQAEQDDIAQAIGELDLDEGDRPGDYPGEAEDNG